MSISRQNLSAVIVTFKSGQVINNCIKSIPEDIRILVVDNSNDKLFKEKLEKNYKNVECILSSENLGMGSGNNLGLKHVITDYAIILNPDVILDADAIQEIVEQSKHINSFAILAPLSKNTDYPNYKLDKNKNQSSNQKSPFQVKSIDGYAMLINLKRLKQLNDFNFFDENFFLYLENDDLCKRLENLGEKIFIVPTSKITHLGGEAVDPKYENEIELSRNWHWMWSKFYFNKKHFGYYKAFLSVSGNLFSAKIKFLFYLITFNNYKRKIYQMRLSGLISSMIGKKSHYRPNLDN